MIALLAACAARVPALPALDAGPDAGPVEGPSVRRACWIELSRRELPRGATVAHHALDADLDGTQSALLLEGPTGTWLVDGGASADLDHEVALTRGLQAVGLRRAAAGWERVTTPADGLRALGVDPATLAGLLPTHGHFDHLGGLLDLPGVRIVVPEAEIDEARRAITFRRSGTTPYDGAALLPRAVPMTFEGGPVWSWDRSHDLLGDGSALVVPMPGHTPGSVGLRVRLPDGRTAFFVGDTVWAREGYEQREPKSWLASAVVDGDSAATAEQIARLAALHDARPDVVIVPAHDRRAWVAAFGEPGCLAPPPPRFSAP